MVNLDGGKIVTVQKAKKDGEKSTKVTLNTMMITTMVIVIMNNGHCSQSTHLCINQITTHCMEMTAISFSQSVREMNGTDEMIYTMTIGKNCFILFVSLFFGIEGHRSIKSQTSSYSS